MILNPKRQLNRPRNSFETIPHSTLSCFNSRRNPASNFSRIHGRKENYSSRIIREGSFANPPFVSPLTEAETSLVPTGRFKTEEGKTKPQEESGDARRCGEALSLVSKRRRGTHGNGYLLSFPWLSLVSSPPGLLLCVPHRHRPLFCLSSPLSPSFSRPLLCRLTIMPGKHSLSRASRERKANRRFQRSLGWEGCESTIVSTISWIIYSSLPHVHSRVLYIYIYIFAEERGSSFHPFRLLEAY